MITSIWGLSHDRSSPFFDVRIAMGLGLWRSNNANLKTFFQIQLEQFIIHVDAGQAVLMQIHLPDGCCVDIPTIPDNICSTKCIRCLECIEIYKVPDTLELKLEMKTK